MQPKEAQSYQKIARDLPRDQLSQGGGTLQQFFEVDFHIFDQGFWGSCGELERPNVRVTIGGVGAGRGIGPGEAVGGSGRCGWCRGRWG